MTTGTAGADVLGGLAVFGVVLVGAGGVDLYETSRLQQHGREADARVVEVVDGRFPALTARYEAEDRTWEADTGRFTDEEVGAGWSSCTTVRTPTDRFQTSSWTDWSEDYDFGYTTVAVGLLALGVSTSGAVLGWGRPRRRGRRT